MSLKKSIFEYLRRIKTGDDEVINEYMEGNLKRVQGLKHEVTFGKHTVVVDEPLNFGGTDMAANPAEVALAGVAASVSVTLQVLALMDNISIDDVRISISGTLDSRGFFDLDPKIRAGFQGLDIKIEIESSASHEVIQALIRKVERSCPVLDTVRNPTPIRITADFR